MKIQNILTNYLHTTLYNNCNKSLISNKESSTLVYVDYQNFANGLLLEFYKKKIFFKI
jgi:hypothetical protein